VCVCVWDGAVISCGGAGALSVLYLSGIGLERNCRRACERCGDVCAEGLPTQHTEALFVDAVSLLSWESLDIVLPVSNVPCLLTSLWIIEKLHGPSALLLLTKF
jgi:hypothetical protein